MSREIKIENKRKILVESINKKYFAIQSKDGSECGQFHTHGFYNTKEEASKILEAMAKEALEKNNQFREHKLVYIEEIDRYKSSTGR